MIVKITNHEGKVAYVDNGGQVNGEVKIQGDEPLVSHLDRILNHRLEITFGGQLEQIDNKYTIFKDGLVYLHKANDNYIKEYFIAKECPAFGYTAEIVKE